MSESRKQLRAALEAVAAHFSAELEKGEAPPCAYLAIAGKKVALEVRAIKPKIGGRVACERPRLRFDRVVIALVRRLQSALREFVPDGKTLVLTVTAPIRLPSKTAEALEDKVRIALARQSANLTVDETIHGNGVRVRLVQGGSRRLSKVIGFVHNPGSNPEVLFDLTRALLDCIGAEVDKGKPVRFSGERWLVLVDGDGLAHIETYRHVYSALAFPADFKKIVVVLPGGRVETLAGKAKGTQI